MRRAFQALVAATALGLAGAAHGAGFSLGVAAGEVSSSSAVLWTRADRAGPVTLQVAADPRFRRGVRTVRLTAGAASDLTVQMRIGGLRPSTRYSYRFRSGRSTSAVGRFTTAPAAAAAATIEFAVTGDADATPRPGTNMPAFNRFEVYAQMAAEGNHFNVNLGDTIYSDSGVAGPPATTVPQKWAKYRLGLALPALPRLRGSASLYSHWDDHEFINDFSAPEHGQAIYEAGVKAFRDYAPVTYSAADGLYRSFRWGRNLELFLLDERSFRSAKASAGGTCNLPGGTVQDLAPTAPQAVRLGFAALAPALAQPVSQACLDRIRDPARTMLGQRQFDRFTAAVRASTATFKVILNEVPMHQYYALPYDRWEGYEAERVRLLEFLSANVRNVVFITTDTHGNFAGEIRLRTLEPAGAVGTGIFEAITGPVATNTFARQIDATLGTPGVASLVTGLFFKPAPPRGIGFACAAPDVYSYLQVRVTSASITLTPKDLNGRPVVEPGGAPCGPFVIAAR